MIPCSGYFRVERGYEIEKSIFNLIIGKSEGIDIEFRIEILDGQIATLVNHRDRSGGVGCTWKYIINQSGYNPSSRITLVYRASVDGQRDDIANGHYKELIMPIVILP